MRAQRSKRYRKIMQQYTLTFGFREPYQVLVSSAFLRAIHRFRMPLHNSLTHVLHGSIKPFITKCSLAAIESESTTAETASKRPVRPPYLPLPTELPLRKCSHNNSSEDIVPEAECLLDLLSGGALSARSINSSSGKMAKNREHFVLASADEVQERQSPPPSKKRKRDEQENVDLRGLARQISGVPIIYVKRSVMVLEELSGASLGARRATEREKIGRRPKTLAMDKDGQNEGGDDEDQEDGGSNEKVEVIEEIEQAPKKKRRRGPKEPNPLSVKKKKVEVKTKTPKGITARPKEPATSETEGTRKTDETRDEKKKRKRKHARGGSGSGVQKGGASKTAMNAG